MPERRLRALAAPFALYGAGALALVAADILIAARFPPERAADWAFFRSAVFVGYGVLLLGADQALVRFPNHASRYTAFAVVQCVALTALVTGALALARPLPVPVPTLAAGLVLFALVALTYGFFRSRLRLVLAQLAMGGWRIVFFALLVATLVQGNPASAEPATLMIVALAVTLTLAVLGGIVATRPASPADSPTAPDRASLAAFYPVALFFFLFSLTLTLSSYLDQLLLGLLDRRSELAVYFAHVAVILAPFVFLGGFLGFALVAAMQANRALTRRRRVGGIAVALLVIGVGVGALVYVAAPAIFGRLYVDKYAYAQPLAVGLIGVGILRVLYVLPSSYMGLFADRRGLAVFLGFGIAGLAIQVAVFFALWTMTGSDILVALVVSVGANWLARSGSGMVLCLRSAAAAEHAA